ncbi:MAG: hypothetical protein HY719_05825 [Planctomycetes bacterium]|nr:hypothetical protein [Planctomycetota bacterium]
MFPRARAPRTRAGLLFRLLPLAAAMAAASCVETPDRSSSRGRYERGFDTKPGELTPPRRTYKLRDTAAGDLSPYEERATDLKPGFE